MAMAKVGDHRGPSLAGPTCSKVNGTNISEELSECKLHVSMKQQHAFDPATPFPFLLSLLVPFPLFFSYNNRKKY